MRGGNEVWMGLLDDVFWTRGRYYNKDHGPEKGPFVETRLY
jgi:hypothetical protein